MLSIIIVGWNCAPTIGACLDSIAAHPPTGSIEVIFVDNASTDAGATIVAGHAVDARVLHNRKNVGFQRGNNQALAVARGDEILLLNPDTELLQGSLDALFGFMRARPEIGAASPRCVYPDGTVQWTVAPFPSLPIVKAWFWSAHPALARLAGRKPPAAGLQHPSTSREQDYAYGACFATRREVVEAVGPMDEAFFLTGG
jgi:GT2 family glycosyltransferase